MKNRKQSDPIYSKTCIGIYMPACEDWAAAEAAERRLSAGGGGQQVEWG